MYRRRALLLARVSALALGALALALAGPARAQEEEPPFERTRLRGASQQARPAADPDEAGSAVRDRDRTAAPGGREIVRRPGRRPPRARERRPATALVVRPVIRGPVVAPATARIVQPDLNAFPEPRPPAAPLRRRPLEANPYDPIGVRLGTLRLYPAIEESVGYDDNPNRTAKDRQKGSLVSRTEGEMRLQSDWSVHELSGLLRGSYSLYPDVREASRPEAEGRLGLRLDATRDLQFDFESRFRLDTERPGSPDLNAEVSERPLNAVGGLSAGATQRFNRLSLGLRGTVDRAIYEDAKLTNGTILDQSDRDTTQYGVRLRAGYEVHPGLIPFVEGTADTRIHDRPVDSSGFRRDSEGASVRLGSTFEITRKLTGEVAAGVQRRTYDDPRLRDITGPVAEAALVWSATPLTTVRLRGQTQIDETTVPFSSGIEVNRATLEVQHDFRRNVTLTAAATLGQSDYQGIRLKEDEFRGSLKLDYKLTRATVLRTSFTHERLKSTAPGADYTANVFLVGLRFQR